MPIFVVIVAAGVLVFLLLKKRAVSALEARLLEVCHGNAEQVERLIADQYRCTHGIRRALAAERALFALTRDRR